MTEWQKSEGESREGLGRRTPFQGRASRGKDRTNLTKRTDKSTIIFDTTKANPQVSQGKDRYKSLFEAEYKRVQFLVDSIPSKK